jgi:hypothetical protein
MEEGRPLFEVVPESRDVAPLWDRAYGGESVVLPRRRGMTRDVKGPSPGNALFDEPVA